MYIVLYATVLCNSPQTDQLYERRINIDNRLYTSFSLSIECTRISRTIHVILVTLVMSDLKMRDDSRSGTVSSVTYSTADEHEVEFNYVRTSDKNQSTDSDISFHRGRCHSIIGCLEKIEKKLSCFHVERRGIERISPEDRVNPTIINTAMIWVRNLFPCFVYFIYFR